MADLNADEDLIPKDERRHRSILDTRVQHDGELSDSDDEGDGGRRNHESFKKRRLRSPSPPNPAAPVGPPTENRNSVASENVTSSGRTVADEALVKTLEAEMMDMDPEESNVRMESLPPPAPSPTPVAMGAPSPPPVTMRSLSPPPITMAAPSPPPTVLATPSPPRVPIAVPVSPITTKPASPGASVPPRPGAIPIAQPSPAPFDASHTPTLDKHIIERNERNQGDGGSTTASVHPKAPAIAQVSRAPEVTPPVASQASTQQSTTSQPPAMSQIPPVVARPIAQSQPAPPVPAPPPIEPEDELEDGEMRD